ncbi:hypothetical protein [Jannaschia seohaensis]|uniref:Lipoprotein n=1 Tax=Jannaschia seohaensis TaxID=475081 RepID=A0A2Y9B344_9RHOB|nr:hypothetical protein BCF38_11641 [Jannaschia seohaensis]SSA50964.1 hypothetical protein SAMN05421539_11641 [Jannaschia seohaensis]
MRAAPLCAALLACAACEMEELPEINVFRPDYQGVETRLLAENLVNLIVRMEGARDGEDVSDYARCAAAQYALIRGFGFARHVRTSVEERAGLWSGDAVYTVSPDLPRGVRTIDAEVVVDDCQARGIPTI